MRKAAMLVPTAGAESLSSSRVFFAETDSSMLDIFPRTLREGLPGLVLDTCSSQDHAMQRLQASPYDVIVSSIGLAEMDDFALFKRARLLNGHAPFIITAGKSERESARSALAQGAVDLITRPLDASQAIYTLHMALRLHGMQKLIVRQETAIARCRQSLRRYSSQSSFDKKMAELIRTNVSVGQGILLAMQSSMEHMEKSLLILRAGVVRSRQDAKQHALLRLQVLS
ncbi:MAG TPA: response regulator [Nitrospira sp.]|nr:response regulator [Nitrospira sp.]